MKIVSQSTILKKSPYYHLAYLAASSKTPSRGNLGAGLLILIFGCILSLRFKKPEQETKGISSRFSLAFRKENKIRLTFGLLCLVIGIAMMSLSYHYGETRYNHPRRMTKVRMFTLSHLISMHLEEGEPIPENMALLSWKWQLPASRIQDAWSNEMKLQKITEDGAIKYLITSAGKDRIFGTEDDIKSDSISHTKEDSRENI